MDSQIKSDILLKIIIENLTSKKCYSITLECTLNKNILQEFYN